MKHKRSRLTPGRKATEENTVRNADGKGALYTVGRDVNQCPCANQHADSLESLPGCFHTPQLHQVEEVRQKLRMQQRCPLILLTTALLTTTKPCNQPGCPLVD